jgi:hypothetical protein
MQRRMLAVAALASLAVAGPVAIARAATTPHVVFGTVTSQGYPIVIKLSKSGRLVVRATIGLDLVCQQPPNITIPDDVTRIAVSATGRFSAEQPVTRVDANPATGVPALDVSAKLIGRVNKARTEIKGVWQRKIVIYDPADPMGVGTPLDTCDTGLLSFKATN